MGRPGSLCLAPTFSDSWMTSYLKHFCPYCWEGMGEKKGGRRNKVRSKAVDVLILQPADNETSKPALQDHANFRTRIQCSQIRKAIRDVQVVEKRRCRTRGRFFAEASWQFVIRWGLRGFCQTLQKSLFLLAVHFDLPKFDTQLLFHVAQLCELRIPLYLGYIRGVEVPQWGGVFLPSWCDGCFAL